MTKRFFLDGASGATRWRLGLPLVRDGWEVTATARFPGEVLAQHGGDVTARCRSSWPAA